MSALLRVKPSERPFLSDVIERVEAMIFEKNGKVSEPSARAMEILIPNEIFDWNDDVNFESQEKDNLIHKR